MNNDSNYTEWLAQVRSTASPRGLDQLNVELIEENQILSQNVYDLQKQLQEAHKRIKELCDL